MITIAIVGILAAIVTPAYTNYTRRSYFSELVNATSPYATAIAACIARTNSLTTCHSGTNGIPAAITTPAGMVARLSVRAGVITATPVAQYGIQATDTYVLTPTRDAASGNVTWTTSGGGVVKGYAK